MRYLLAIVLGLAAFWALGSFADAEDDDAVWTHHRTSAAALGIYTESCLTFNTVRNDGVLIEGPTECHWFLDYGNPQIHEHYSVGITASCVDGGTPPIPDNPNYANGYGYLFVERADDDNWTHAFHHHASGGMWVYVYSIDLDPRRGVHTSYFPHHHFVVWFTPEQLASLEC